MLRNVTIQGRYIEGTWLLLESFNELTEYMEFTSGRVVEQITRLLRSKVSPERWDHMITRTPEGSILAASIIYCQAHGKSPLIEMDGIIQQKFLNMANNISQGKKLLVNPLGGYCYMTEDISILSEETFETGFQLTYTVNENTQYINLENDPELEERTRQYLGERDPNYSYILNLHKFSKDDLIKVFTEFKENGGSIVHVYTTGTNVPQMYEYFDAAKEAGLNDFVFEFNAGTENGIAEFISHIKPLCNLSLVK